MLVTVKVAGMISTLPCASVRVSPWTVYSEAEDFLGRRVAQRARLAEDPVFALGAEVAADVGGVAAREQHPILLRGDDARRGGELVAVEDHCLAQERLDQVERDRGDAVDGDISRANPRRQARRAGAADGSAHAQPRAAVRLVEEQHLAGEDQVRISHLLEVHAPELGPAPRALQVHLRDVPERVARLDGVDVGRGRQDLAQRHARFGGLLRGRALLRRDREVGLGGERGRGEQRAEGADRELPEGGGRRENSSAHAGSLEERTAAHMRLIRKVFRNGFRRPPAVRRKSHLVSQILPIKH
jgi:hypothetical protein